MMEAKHSLWREPRGGRGGWTLPANDIRMIYTRHGEIVLLVERGALGISGAVLCDFLPEEALTFSEDETVRYPTDT